MKSVFRARRHLQRRGDTRARGAPRLTGWSKRRRRRRVAREDVLVKKCLMYETHHPYRFFFAFSKSSRVRNRRVAVVSRSARARAARREESSRAKSLLFFLGFFWLFGVSSFPAVRRDRRSTTPAQRTRGPGRAASGACDLGGVFSASGTRTWKVMGTGRIRCPRRHPRRRPTFRRIWETRRISETRRVCASTSTRV